LIARLSPLVLPASAKVRLRRLWPEAVLKEDARQLVVPLAAGEDPVEALTELLRELVPPIPSGEKAKPRESSPTKSADSMPVP